MARPIGYTGYYPGERIPRPPGGGKPQPPITYDLNVLGQSVEEMEFAVGDIPSWTKERLTKAIESSLRVTIYGKTLDASSLAAYDEGELEEEFSEISGTAGFAVNLNPADIAKDPKKWAGKLVSGAYSELTSLSDIESRKRKAIWSDIVGLAGNGDTLVRDLTKKRALRIGGAEDDTDAHPLELTKIPGYEKEGKALAEKIVDFQGNIRTVVSRDKNFDEVLRTSFSGTRKVLANSAGKVTGGLGGREQERALSFIAKLDLAQNMQSVDEKAKDVITTIGRLKGLGAEINPVDKKGNPLRVEDSVSALQNEIDKSRAHITLMTSGRLDQKQQELLGMMDDRGQTIADNLYVVALAGRRDGVLSTTEARRLERTITRYERILGKIEKGVATPNFGSTAALSINKLFTATSDLSGSGSGRRYNSAERSFLRSLGDEFTRGSASGVAGDERLEDLIRRVDADGYKYMNRSRTLLPTLEKDRQFFAVDDFMDVLYEDDLYSKFLWITKINPRLQALTPDYYVKQFMVKMHYFGLVIDEKSLAGPNGELIEPKFFLFKWANKIVQKSQEKGGAFANKFSIGIEGFGKHIVKGGNHFGGVKELSKLLTDKKISAAGLRDLMRAKNPEDIKNILKGIVDKDFKLDEFAEKFLKFQDWAKKNAKRLGIDWEKGEDMMEVVGGLMRYDNETIKNVGIGITKAYRGKLSQFVQKLSVLQNKIFNSFLGKVAGKLVSWKMAISTAISEAVMDALGVATGGAAFLLKPLQLLLQAAIRIVLDVGEKVVMSIIKADFGELSKFLDKSLTSVVKFLVQISAAITIAAVIPFLIVATLLSAISPENNAKVGGIGDFGLYGGPGGVPPGGEITCPMDRGADLTDPRDDPQTSVELNCNTGNAIVDRACHIVDELRPGFWCYWNYSPDYPGLFDLARFAQHPNHCVYNKDCSFPSGCTSPSCPPGPLTSADAINLHWCTHLTMHAYEGHFTFTTSTYTPDQVKYFQKIYSYVLASRENLQNKVKPGDAIFFTNGVRESHVGVVYSVNTDYMIIVESNAYSKKRTIVLNSQGKVESGQGVAGFGIIPTTP